MLIWHENAKSQLEILQDLPYSFKNAKTESNILQKTLIWFENAKSQLEILQDLPYSFENAKSPHSEFVCIQVLCFLLEMKNYLRGFVLSNTFLSIAP